MFDTAPQSVEKYFLKIWMLKIIKTFFFDFLREVVEAK